MDLQKFYMGVSFDSYEYFGAHLVDSGVVFRTYAPNAWGINVVGEFNGWKEEPLQQLHQSGTWVGFSKDAQPGQMYKYVIYGQNGREVACFLQSAANYWLKEYHFDGLRMDAISRLIYWQGDEKRGENGAAINFLKIMNQGLHRLHTSAMLITEDSTAYPGVTKDLEESGLGFDYKWDLGWMHDTLKYFQCHPYDRANMPDKITFSIYYAYNERYILPFSHDEVVHGKKTIIDKLNGSYAQKFAQVRLLYLYMMTHPGKKLNFMGNELAMFREWDEKREPDWELLNLPAHDSFHRYIRELNRLYLKKKTIWALDHTYDGFKWIDCNSDNTCVFGYTRTDGEKTILVIVNFSDTEAAIAPELDGSATMLLNTDWEVFGGKTRRSMKKYIEKRLPPYCGVLYELK